MKRLFTIAAAVVLAICGLQMLYLSFGRNGQSSDAVQALQPKTVEPLRSEPSAAQASGRRLDLPTNIKQAVDFSVDEGSFADFTAREREDQYRDWLLFAAVAALQPSAEEYNKILFDLPASRQGYMRPTGTFEFGETRSRFIGNGRGLALIPAAARDAQRKDFLGLIADEQRKNLGEPFDSLIVVEYELDAGRGRATLTRRDDVGYAALFSAEYGYHEALVTSAAELEQFMKRVSDLTAAQKAPAGLKLGGRKLLGRDYRSIGVEQVATVWQSEQKIYKALDEWEARAKRAFDELDARWAGRTYRGEAQRQQLTREHQREVDAIKERFARERRDLKLVGGSGFSLDPAFDFDRLRKAFEAFAPEIARRAPDIMTEQRVAETSQALASDNVEPLLDLGAAFEKDQPLLAKLVERLARQSTYQVARYDGALQGTEVGMILFYTDLLAKLWTIDFVDSSPRRGRIRDFVDDPSVPLSLIYEAEGEQLPYARLWFGPSDLGFQLAGEKSELLLSRTATRIYSAGSNPLHPGVEAETSAFLAASTDWWNDHYDEVARYEPEYERLNQIMKWSLVIGWLNDINEGARLGFLSGVTVDHSKVFPAWAPGHPELRFRRWQDVGFYEAGYKGTQTEALPRLSGPVTSGGVSLASKDAAKRAPIALQIEKATARSNLDYGASTGKGALKALDGTVFTFKSGDATRASMLVKAKQNAKFRGQTVQLARNDIERAVVARADAVRVETRVGDVPFGELEIERSSNGFSIGWRARETDRAQSIARSLSAAGEPDLAILRDPAVETVVKLPGEATYAAKLRDSPRWVKLAPEARPGVDISEGWQLRAAATDDKAVRRMQASVVDETQIRAVVSTQTHIVLEGAGDGKPLLRLAPDNAPTGARIVDVDVGGERFSAWLEPPADTLHIASKGGGEFETIGLAQRLKPEEIEAIRKAAANSNVPPVVPVADAPQAQLSLRAELQNGEFRKAASAIVEDAVAARRALDARMKSDLQGNSNLLKTKGPNEALHDLDRLIATYGKQPDLMLRRGLVEIERGNPQVAMESALSKRPLGDRQAFFDEVNARLAAGPRHAREELHRYAEYVDWQDVSNQPSRVASASGSVRPTMVADRFDFEFRLNSMPAGRPVSLAELGKLRRGDAIVYRQSNVTFSGVNWSASTDQSLRQVISGNLGKVIRLPQQDIAHFRPSLVWAPEHAAPFKAAEGNIQHLSTGAYQSCNAVTEICSDSDQKQSRPEAYLVVAN
jgi:hypothetical protein